LILTLHIKHPQKFLGVFGGHLVIYVILCLLLKNKRRTPLMPT
jgi:hypothetical protein